MDILTEVDSILNDTPNKHLSHIDQIDSILNEPQPQFEDDIVSDIENTLQIKPMDFTDKVSFAVETGLNIPNNIVNSIAKAIRGSDKTAEDTVLDNVINFTSQYNKSYTDKYSKFAEANAPAGILPFKLPGIKVKDIQGVSSNLGATITTLLAGLGAGAAAIETGPVGMGLAAGSVGGATAYRMAISDFSDNIKQMFDAESMKNNGRKLDQAEWDQIRTKYESDAMKYGLWEAVPEALGTAVTLGVGKMVMSTAKNILKRPLMKVAKSLAGLFGEVATEVGTETATSYGQSGVMADAFGTPKQTLGESFKEVLRPTVAMSVVGLPLGIGAGAVQNKLQLMIDKKLNIKQFSDLVQVEDGEPDNSVLYTWAMQNKDKADILVSKEKPSRADIETAFGDKFRTTSEERNYIAQSLKSFDYKAAEQDISFREEEPVVETPQSTPQATQQDTTQEPVAVRNPEEDKITEEALIEKITTGESLTDIDMKDINNLPPEVADKITTIDKDIDDKLVYLEDKLIKGQDISKDDRDIFFSLPPVYQDRLKTVTEWAANDLTGESGLVDEEQEVTEIPEDVPEMPTANEEESIMDMQEPEPTVVEQPKPKIGMKKTEPKPATQEEKVYTSIVENIKSNKEFEDTITIGEKQFTVSANIKEGNEKGFDYKIGKRVLPDKESFVKEVKKLLRLEKETSDIKTMPKDIPIKERLAKTKENREKIKKNYEKFLASIATPGTQTVEERVEKSDPFKLFDALAAAAKEHGVKFGAAREKVLKGNAGLYSSRTRNVYVKSTNDVITASHEVAHNYDMESEVFKDIIDYKTETFLKKYNLFPKGSPYNRLMQLYIDEYSGFKDEKRSGHDPIKKIKEGFATLVERLIAEPKRMKAEYPDLVQWLEGKNISGVKKFIKDFSDIIEKYQSLSPIDKVGAKMYTKAKRTITNKYLNSIVELGLLSKENAEKIQSLGAHGGIRQSLFHAISRIEDMEDKLIGNRDLSDAMQTFRLVNGIISTNIFTKGAYQILKGDEYIEALKFNVKDLFDSVSKKAKSLKMDIDNFSKLLIQRRVYGDWIKIDKINSELEKYTSKYGFDSVEDMVDLIDEVQAETPEEKKQLAEVKKIIEQYKSMKDIVKKDGYTREEATIVYKQLEPFFREELKLYDAIMKARLDTLKDVGIISQEQYDEYKADKFYTSFQRYFFQNHVDNLQKEATTTTQSMIGSLKKRKGDYNPIYAPLEGMIDSEISYQKDAMRQLIYNKFIPIMNRLGIEKIDNRNDYKDEEYIVTKKDGKPTSWHVGSDMRNMIHSIVHPKQPGMIEKIFTKAAQIKTVGTTAAYWPFAFNNFLVDQASAYVNSQNEIIPFASALNTMKSLYIEKNPELLAYANEYDRVAKNNQTIYGLYDRDPESRRDLILKESEGIKKYLQKANEWGSRGLDILQIPVQFTETITRKTEYIKARKAGKPMFRALREAGDVTTPFHHSGSNSTMRAIIRSIPFFNASLQVLDMTRKAFLGNDKKMQKRAILAMATITTSMVFGLASVMGFGSEESKKLLSQKSPNELARNLYIPWFNGGLLEFRVPENMTTLATMINMGLLEVFGNADYKGSELVNGAMAWAPDQLNPLEFSQMLISWMPQLLKPAIEVMMDKKTYPTVQPLTPYTMQSMPKGMQESPNSSLFAKIAGNNLLSPIQIDHLIEGYAGRAARLATGRWGLVFKWPYIINWAYFTSGRVVQNFFSTYKEANAVVSAVESGKMDIKNLDQSYLKKIYSLKTIGDSINKVMKIYRGIEKEKLNDDKSISLRNNILNLIDKFNEV
jgi:hypothetical protein